jgi:hypothetical protein
MAIENVKIRPMYVYLGENTYQVQKISCKADVAGSLGAKYFLFHDAAGAKHYAWFNTGASVDPAPAGGWTGHEVAISSGDSASAVATALAAILTAVTGFDATASGAQVTLTHTAYGYSQPARDPNSAAKTGFDFVVTALGAVEVSAGCIQGDIELSGFEPQVQEITCHATGTTPKAELITGYASPELTMTFQETDKETMKKAFVMAGQYSFTPVGADGEESIGYGLNNLGEQIATTYIKMVPVNPDLSTASETWHVWKAKAQLDTITFSGENIAALPLTFKLYPDESKAINGLGQFFMIGNKPTTLV